jgi:hypothetical protein
MKNNVEESQEEITQSKTRTKAKPKPKTKNTT